MAKMLIVDDSADNRDFCELIAKMYNVEVKQAADVDEALAILQTGYTPGVILLDLMMPGRQPDDLVDYVKQKPRLAHTKVILTSAVRDLGLIAKDMGADESLRKPYNMREFVDSFRRTSLIAI